MIIIIVIIIVIVIIIIIIIMTMIIIIIYIIMIKHFYLLHPLAVRGVFNNIKNNDQFYNNKYVIRYKTLNSNNKLSYY